MLNEWQKQIQQRSIPFSDNFNLIEQLNDEATVEIFFFFSILTNKNHRLANGIYKVCPMMIFRFRMESLRPRTTVIHFLSIRINTPFFLLFVKLNQYFRFP